VLLSLLETEIPGGNVFFSLFSFSRNPPVLGGDRWHGSSLQDGEGNCEDMLPANLLISLT